MSGKEKMIGNEKGTQLKVTVAPHFSSNNSTRKVMLDVIIAMLPMMVAGIYYFGLRALVITAVCIISCVVFELLFCKITHRPSTIGDLSAVVTGMLLGFGLPVTFPFWMAVVGSFFAIIVVKCLFGGIGYNFANPAATARVFLLISFTAQMTKWVAPTGAGVHGSLAGSFAGVDYVASATPLGGMAQLPNLTQMLMGQRAGCLGETCVVAIVIGGIYLMVRGVISYVIPVSVIASTFVFALLFGANPVYAILSGGLMITAFFMATDYATCPFTTKGKWIYGIGIGFFTMVIRQFCDYPEGVSFAILLMNIMTPHIDRLTKSKPFGAIFEKKAKNGGAKA